ncbi:MAG: hypothetical protein HLX50_21170 [Alteromonadaceae bacterium]|nr:hypothetical protein [Alteromonadaceae bacterium]
MTHKRILLSSLVCLVCVLGLSATGLAINLWLGFERNLAGNLGAVVITALLLCRWRSASLTASRRQVFCLSTVCGAGGLIFLMLLAELSPFGAYSFDPLSVGEAMLAFLVNALVFFCTVWFAQGISISKSSCRR